MPYYLIPGDLLLLSPMYFVRPGRSTRSSPSPPATAVSSAGSRAGPRAFGRFQFVLGRELGVTFYGLWGETSCSRRPFPPADSGGWSTSSRRTSTCRSSSTAPTALSPRTRARRLFQLFAGADVPHGESVAAPIGAPTPSLRTVWSVGLRMTFDWRCRSVGLSRIRTAAPGSIFAVAKRGEHGSCRTFSCSFCRLRRVSELWDALRRPLDRSERERGPARGLYRDRYPETLDKLDDYIKACDAVFTSSET